MRDPGRENTMYILRSKSVSLRSVNYVSAYPLQSTLRLFLGEGWSSPLRIRVSAYPLQTTLRLFLGEGWSLPLRIPRIHFMIKLRLDYFWGKGGLRHFVSTYPYSSGKRLGSGRVFCSYSHLREPNISCNIKRKKLAKKQRCQTMQITSR